MTPLISVIVPVYNVERYLDRCLDSIIKQTLENLEIILVDDGSTDASGKMCDEWCEKDKRITVVHQQNKGLAGARNTGIRYSHGEFIGFIDSDDWITNDYYEYLYKLMITNDADIASCAFRKVTGECEFKCKKRRVDVYQKDEAQIFFMNSAIRNSLNDASCCTKLYKRNVIGKVRFEEGMIYEDVVFNWKALAYIKRYVKSYEPKYYYFVNNQSITMTDFSDKNFDLVRGAKIISQNSSSSYEIKKITEEYMAKCHFSLAIKMLRSNIIDINLLQKELVFIKENHKIIIRSKLSIPRKIVALLLIVVPNRWICKFKNR